METLKKLFSPLPAIREDGLELRPLRAADADALRELTASSEVYRTLPTFLFEKNTATRKPSSAGCIPNA